MMKDKIAFVCQRYGLEVNGGAEAECRMYAERLTATYDVEVLTTCAVDYVTWANHYPAGTEKINDVLVRRFPVARKRDQKSFDSVSALVLNPSHADQDEKRWLDAQGPYCPELVRYLDENGIHYRAILFMTYLYYSTARGIFCQARRKLLIPTAHDEWPIYQRQFKKVFEAADGYIYNTRGEKRFVEERFPFAAQKSSVTVGAGVTYPKNGLPDIKKQFGIDSPYVCYCGRIDESKGCGMLFDFFKRYKQTHRNDLMLVLTGKAVMDIPKRKDIVSLGFVSEEEKYAVMKNSTAFVLASEFESLSIVVLESMMMGRPVLVNGKCEVLKDHCLLSNAGFYFMNYKEFEAELDYLLTHEREYQAMCENGKRYVKERYQWEQIVKKICGLIEKD